MTRRIDAASKVIAAGAPRIFRAFGSAQALESWLPPSGMKGRVLRFEFREGAGYRMRLTYDEPSYGTGKTSAGSDEVEVRFLRLIPDRLIQQVVGFDSEKAEFAGSMKMTWSFEPVGEDTEVTVRCENVPAGIRQEDHEAGLASTLDNLARFACRDDNDA